MVEKNFEKLKNILRMARAADKTIGLITGTFDITHIDHANAIQQAKKYCNILIVAVKDNAGAARKDPRRPIWDENERLNMVNYIKGVDFVVLANYLADRKITCEAENEKQEDWLTMFEPIFDQVRPNILFHEPNPVLQSARESASKKYGFELFPIERGTTTSTTNTVETILKRYGKERAED